MNLANYIFDFRRYLAGIKKRDLTKEEQDIVLKHLQEVERNFVPDEYLFNIEVALSFAIFMKVGEIHPEMELPNKAVIHTIKLRLRSRAKQAEEIQNRNRNFIS